MRRVPRWIQIPFVPVILAPIILFLPILVTGKAIYWGTPYLQFVPWRYLAFEILTSGSLPLWNAQVGMGAPLMANYQSALFYPTTWLLFVFQAIGGISMMAWSQTLIVIMQLILAGLGMVYLCKSLKLSVLAQTIAGLAYAMCGYLVARIGFLSINAAASWIPWIILAGSRIAKAGGEPGALRFKPMFKVVFPLVICLGFQLLAGHAQTTYYTLLLLVAWIIFWGFQNKQWQGVFRSLGLTAIAILIAFLLSAVQLIPTAEFLLQSQRASSVAYDVTMNYSFFPLRLVTLIIPNLFGTPAQGNYLLHADNYWEDAIYIGFIPCVLAIAGFWKSIRSKQDSQPGRNTRSEKTRKRLALFLSLMALCSLILAFGDNTPVFPFFYKYIPTFDLFQAPARFTIILEFGLVLLAALGADLWRRPDARAIAWTRRGIAVSISILFGAIIGIFLLPGIQTVFITAMATTGLLGIALGIFNLLMPVNEKKKTVWNYLVICIIGLDLMVADWGLNPGIALTAYQFSPSDVAQVNALRGDGRIYLDSQSENNLKFDQFFQFNNFYNNINISELKDAMVPDSNILAGISSANNFDPLVPARYARWMNYLTGTSAEIQSRMYALMDVSLVESVDKASPTGVSFTKFSAQKVTWSNCVVTAKGQEDAWEKTIDLVQKTTQANQVDPIIIENPPGTSAGPCDTTQKAQISSYVEQPNQIKMDVSSPGEGWMMLANTWYPGWTAYVDGQPTPVLHADYLFLAVQVPEGKHTVEIAYKPTSFYAGALLSVLGIVVLLIGYWLSKKKM